MFRNTKKSISFVNTEGTKNTAVSIQNKKNFARTRNIKLSHLAVLHLTVFANATKDANSWKPVFCSFTDGICLLCMSDRLNSCFSEQYPLTLWDHGQEQEQEMGSRSTGITVKVLQAPRRQMPRPLEAKAVGRHWRTRSPKSTLGEHLSCLDLLNILHPLINSGKDSFLLLLS